LKYVNAALGESNVPVGGGSSLHIVMSVSFSNSDGEGNSGKDILTA